MVLVALQKRVVMWVNERGGQRVVPAPYMTSFPYDLVSIPSPVYYMDFYCIFSSSAERHKKGL